MIFNFLHYYEQFFVFFSEGAKCQAKKVEILTRNNVLKHVQGAKVVVNFMHKIITLRTGVVCVPDDVLDFLDLTKKTIQIVNFFCS